MKMCVFYSVLFVLFCFVLTIATKPFQILKILSKLLAEQQTYITQLAKYFSVQTPFR